MKQQAFLFLFLFISCGLQACHFGDNEASGGTSVYDGNDASEETSEETPVCIAVFGDIQYLTEDYKHIDVYKHSIDWIRSEADKGRRFNCILHTGDITQTNSKYQWNHFIKATKPVVDDISVITMTGDHDYTWEDNSPLIVSRESTFINDYLQFPLVTAKVLSWFEEGHMENIVVENTIHGQRLDFLILEFAPRKAVVEWADAYVKAHPDHHFILLNHEYLEKDGGLRTTNLKCVLRLTDKDYVTPEQLWNNLIKCNDNIRVVLCGHVGGLYALTVTPNDYGRDIPQIHHNIQQKDYRYDNWLMLWEFPAESDSANICIYNTKAGKYFNDEEVLFRYKYRD